MIKEYYEQLYAYTFDNLHEMDQFLERHNLPDCTQEKDNVDSPISIKDIESTMNNLPKQKAPGPDEFNGEFHQTFKE